MDRTIIESLFDLDFYKLTMQQLQYLRHPSARVKLRFKCRTRGVNLPEVIPVGALREQLDHLRELRVTDEELSFLRHSRYIPHGMFRDRYLEFLGNLQLPEIILGVSGNDFIIESEGEWPVVTLTETLVLSVVNEMYNHYQLKEHGRDERDELWPLGYRVLADKIQLLAMSRLSDALVSNCLIEFGTRRRESRAWQREVTMMMSGEIPHIFAGTSNVHLAMELGLRPVGTFAHEMDMVYSRLFGDSDDDIRRSHGRMMLDWWELYGEPLSVALTDTYGTDFFFRDMLPSQVRNWLGLRHDSGPWKPFGEKVVSFYKRHDVDPKCKTVVWSDGLSPEVILAINEEFGRHIKCKYGWGTNLTNDFGSAAQDRFGVRPLSIVMKVVESNFLPTVKLSDNPAKAIGPTDTIARFQRVFGYNPDNFQYEECVY